MATTFMNLDLPTVSVTLGPEWATMLNAALTTVDTHDHTSGKGKLITVAALSINDDLSFESHAASDVLQLGLEDNVSSPPEPLQVYAKDGDLYYNNGSAVPVQITDGGSVVTVPSTVQALERIEVATDTTIGSSDTTVYVSVDASAPRTITLPLASAVAGGRLYIVKDATEESETNTLTVALSGSDTFPDGSTSLDFDSDGAAFCFIGNGVDGYEVW